jgi:hypothetical protein
MKKRLLTTILMILMYLLLTSVSTCTSTSAKSPERDSLMFMKYEMIQDTNILKILKKDSAYVSFTPTVQTVDTQDQKIIVKKEIPKKMEVDTAVKVKSQNYEKLEKTQMEIKEQQKTLDSMLVVKRKK